MSREEWVDSDKVRFVRGKPQTIGGRPLSREEWVAEHWERCKPWLEAALATYPLQTHTMDNVREALERGNAQLWPTEKSAAVVEIIKWPSGLKTLHHWLTGGDLDELMVTEKRVEDYAREHGFAAITTCGREGWRRVMPGYRRVAGAIVEGTLMGKSSKPQVTTTQSQTVMPEYVQDAQRNLLGTGQSVLAPYLNAGTSGYGVAGLNQDQNNAFQGVRDMAASNGLDPASISRYLNPYTASVVDATNSTLRDQNDQTLAGIRAQTAASSSFGGSGSRGALLEGQANKALGDTIASTTAQLMSSGYDRATATALASEQMKQSNLEGLLNIGNQQQQLDQTKLDVPLTALQRLSAITPQQYGSSTNSTTTAPPQQSSSPLQQILGGGLSLLGMGTGFGTTLGGSLFGKLVK